MNKKSRMLYQYRNSQNFNRFLDSLYAVVAAGSPEDLLRFLDIDNAVGDWLTQLADLFNVPRSYVQVGTAFILDFSLLDGTDQLDGASSPINDTVLRALLKARILRNIAQVKSLDYMYNVWNKTVVPPVIQITEGIKTLTINLTFITNSAAYWLYVALVSLDNKWFGVPSGCSVTYNVTLI
jgi:hypothetical protein